MFKRSLRITVLAAVVVAVGISGVAASADVAPVDPYLLQVANGDAPTNPTSQAGPGGVAPRGGGSTSYAVTCTGQIQDPHYSSGADGAIGTGFWRATFTWQITSLPNATVGSDTKTVWKGI